jgi:ribonuclease P protein component
VLPAPHRLRHSNDFRRTVRQGRRLTASTLVVHALSSSAAEPAKVGFVVSRAVGKAVQRNTVKRRLRHAVVDHLDQLTGFDLVVRAKPEAAAADYARLKSDIDRCCRTLEEANA